MTEKEDREAAERILDEIQENFCDVCGNEFTEMQCVDFGERCIAYGRATAKVDREVLFRFMELLDSVCSSSWENMIDLFLAQEAKRSTTLENKGGGNVE